MTQRIAIFLTLTCLFFVGVYVLEPKIFLEFSNTDSIGFVISLQVVASAFLIGIITIRTFLTKEKRKKKKYESLGKRMKFWIPMAFIILTIDTLRNEHNASDWVESLKFASIMFGMLSLSSLPVFIFYFTFYPYLGGLKKSEPVGGHNSGSCAASA